MDIKVRLKQFEGPLDLLLYLVQKHEMDIHDINVAEITQQYLDMIDAMRELDMDQAAEYLLMAATLTKLKSETLLPSAEEEMETVEGVDQIKTKEELERRLQELLLFKKVGEKLGLMPKLGEQVFEREVEPREVIRERILATPEMTALMEGFTEFLYHQSRKMVPIKSDRVTIKDKVLQLRNLMQEGEQVEFDQLINTDKNDELYGNEVIVSFITILELSRLGKCAIFQNESLGPIYIKANENLMDLDLSTMTGFDPEDDKKEEKPSQKPESSSNVLELVSP